MTRFVRPAPGSATPIRFPAIEREELANGLAIWTIPHRGVPVVSASLVIAHGSIDDPDGLPGLASLTGDLLDEGAGSRDAIALAEAFGRIGTDLSVEVGPDATSLSVSGLARALPPALELLADVVMRPRMAAPDFARVRELRLNRLRQLSRSAGTTADRAYVSAIFGAHPYGRGALGTTAALERMTLADAQVYWASTLGPQASTFIVSGDVTAADVGAAVRQAFSAWAHPDSNVPSAGAPATTPDVRILLIDRPGSPQSELRIGHVGPPRTSPEYHAVVALNAVLGGQFTSRINRRLREEMGITYGARTSFDFRRLASTFSCDTSVQADATADAVGEVLAQFERIRTDEVSEPELDAAKASLTRGYVRNFETAGQLARAAVQLVTHRLPDHTFDRFVPSVEAVTAADVHKAATSIVRPDHATVVVVGDASVCRNALERLGRPVAIVTPEF